MKRNWLKTDTEGNTLSLAFKDIQLSGDSRISTTGLGTVLTIKNVTLKDEGKYACNLVPTNPIISLENYLEVEGKCNKMQKGQNKIK